MPKKAKSTDLNEVRVIDTSDKAERKHAGHPNEADEANEATKANEATWANDENAANETNEVNEVNETNETNENNEANELNKQVDEPNQADDPNQADEPKVPKTKTEPKELKAKAELRTKAAPKAPDKLDELFAMINKLTARIVELERELDTLRGVDNPLDHLFDEHRVKERQWVNEQILVTLRQSRR